MLQINISISNSQSMTRLSSLERHLTHVYPRVLRNKRLVIASTWPACFFRYQAMVCCSSVRIGDDIASAPRSVAIIGNKLHKSAYTWGVAMKKHHYLTQGVSFFLIEEDMDADGGFFMLWIINKSCLALNKRTWLNNLMRVYQNFNVFWDTS